MAISAQEWGYFILYCLSPFFGKRAGKIKCSFPLQESSLVEACSWLSSDLRDIPSHILRSCRAGGGIPLRVGLGDPVGPWAGRLETPQGRGCQRSQVRGQCVPLTHGTWEQLGWTGQWAWPPGLVALGTLAKGGGGRHLCHLPGEEGHDRWERPRPAVALDAQTELSPFRTRGHPSLHLL